MATLLSLADAERLVAYNAQMPEDVQPQRILYMLPGQIESRIETAASNWRLEISPLEQLDDLLSSFCEGAQLTYNWHFKDLLHAGEDVWELKRPDIRLFGWFVQRNCFVATTVDLAWRIKEVGLYGPYIRQAVADREGLKDALPSWVEGNDPDDVVSNWRETPQEGGL